MRGDVDIVNIPDVTFNIMTNGRPQKITSAEVFNRKSVVLFGIPGAYTPTCHYLHIPGILDEIDTFKSNGIDTVACTAVNDIDVLHNWAQELGAADKILFLADGNGTFAKSLNLLLDGRDFGLGFRSKRYSMWVNDGRIECLNIEPDFEAADISSAGMLLEMFGRWARESHANFYH